MVSFHAAAVYADARLASIRYITRFCRFRSLPSRA
jgi:hypothetical protein